MFLTCGLSTARKGKTDLKPKVQHLQFSPYSKLGHGLLHDISTGFLCKKREKFFLNPSRVHVKTQHFVPLC